MLVRVALRGVSRRSIGLAAVFALAVGGLQALTPHPAVASTPCPAAMSTVAEATSAAASCGGQVEVLSLRTTTSQTFVQPDGTAVVNSYASPQWAPQQDGSWIPIDTSLRLVNGKFVPGATVLPVTFSAGGDTALASLNDGSQSVALTWGSTLPSPTISGDTATYPEVYTGVDLQVTALPEGFSELLVIKTAAAANNPALATINFGVATGGGSTASAAADGGVNVTDTSGATVFNSPRALMWDATPVDTAAAASAKGLKTPADNPGGSSSGTAAHEEPMGESLSSGTLAVVPDQSFLTSSSTVYPVYVDPTFTGGRAGGDWAVVASRSDLANQSFWHKTFMTDGKLVGDAGAGETCDNWNQPDTCITPAYKVRSLFRMDMSGTSGAKVLSATFAITQKWSWTCNPSPSNTQLWLTGSFNSATTWNNQPNWDSGHTVTALGNHAIGKYNGCADAGEVNFDVTPLVNYIGTGASSISLGLRSPNESSVDAWKRFDSSSAQLHIVYDHVPNTPGLRDLTMGDTGQIPCGTSSYSPAKVNTSNGLTLHAVLSDLDSGSGDMVRANWSVIGIPAANQPPTETNGTVSGSEHVASIPATAFTDGQAFSWQVRGIDTSSNLAGGYSPTCYAQVDNAALKAATVASTDLNLRTTGSGTGLGIPPTASANAVVGRTDTATFTPASGDATRIAGYKYGLATSADVVPTLWVPAAANGSVTAPVVPITAKTPNYLAVEPISQTGAVGVKIVSLFLATAATGTTTHVINDFTGDGRSEAMALNDVGGGTSSLYQWDSTSTTGAFSTAFAPQGADGIYPSGNLQRAYGDFNGDGKADVATLVKSGTGVQLEVERSDGNQLLSVQPSIGNGSATLSNISVANIKFVAADFNGDGKADLGMFVPGSSGGWQINVLLSTAVAGTSPTDAGTMSFATPVMWNGSTAVSFANTQPLVGDFNGDGKADLIEVYNAGGATTQMFVHYSTGTAFQSGDLQFNSGTGNFDTTRSKYVAADFTGDGKADVGALYDYGNGSVALMVNSTVTSTGKLGSSFGGWYRSSNFEWDWTSTSVNIGDFNADGKVDVALYQKCCGSYQGRISEFLSSGTAFPTKVSEWAGAAGPVIAGAIPQDSTTHNYHVIPVNSGLCLAAATTGTTPPVYQHACSTSTGSPSESWTLHSTGGNLYQLQLGGSTGNCADVNSGGITNGTTVVSNSCAYAWGWYRLTYQSGGLPGTSATVTINLAFNPSSCLDVTGASTADGAPLQEWACNNQTNQSFTLKAVS